MIRILQSPWLAAIVGCLLYLVVLLGLIHPSRFDGVKAVLARSQKANHGEEPSWAFRNPEYEQSLEEIRREKEALALRAQQLQELQTRLDAERQELTTVTQTVFQLQADFDRNVVRIKDQELENLKRQAKVLAGMSPEAASNLINQMPDEEAVRILYTMKPEEASAVLEAMSKLGKPEAKRAAFITERMRHALPPDPNARPKNSP